MSNDDSKKTSGLSAEKLAGFPMLQGVGLTVRQDLLHAGEERNLEKGAVLLRQGDANETMYLLTEGELAIHLDSIDDDPIAIIRTGEIVGELSLLDGSDASAHVVAHTACKVLAVSEEGFWTLTNDSHAFAVQLLVKLAERLRANNAAVSKNVKKRRMYERAAMFDGLTGIHNRRWLDDTLHRLTKRAKIDATPLSVSLLDIDHFKRFNDTYGHEAGDHVLTIVANTLAKNLRPTDLVARFGGEEFVIIFPDTRLETAALAADRVRNVIAGQKLVMADGRELPCVTISMGVAELEPEQEVANLLKVADSAMYRAKQSGRNRVLTGTSADLEVP